MGKFSVQVTLSVQKVFTSHGRKCLVVYLLKSTFLAYTDFTMKINLCRILPMMMAAK